MILSIHAEKYLTTFNILNIVRILRKLGKGENLFNLIKDIYTKFTANVIINFMPQFFLPMIMNKTKMENVPTSIEQYIRNHIECIEERKI